MGYSRGIDNYLEDKSKITASTARETESADSCSQDSVLHKNVSSLDQSVISSLHTARSAILSPCVICKVAERTHISMPCMHYSFCSACSEELSKIQLPICPICQTKDIIFSPVYT